MKRFIAILIIISSISASLFSGETGTKRIKSLLFERKYTDVIQLLESKSPRSAEECYLLGYAYLNINRGEDAVRALVEANRIDTANIRYRSALGEAYLSMNLDDEAEDTFEQILAIDSLDQNAALNLGKIWMTKRRYSKVIGLYERFVNRQTGNYYFDKGLGKIYASLDSTEKATEHFKKAICINKYDPDLYISLGQLYLKMEKPDSSIKFLDLGLAIYPNDHRLNKLKGEVFFKEGDYLSAVAFLVKALPYIESNPLIYQKLGLSYYFLSRSEIFRSAEERVKKMKEALIAFQTAYQEDNKDPLTTYYLGIVFRELREFNNAVVFFEETLDNIYPDYLAEVYTQIGLTREDLKEYPEAIKAYKKSSEINPDNKNIIFQLATLYDKYYYDREVPLIYYYKYLKDDGEVNDALVEYSVSRIEAIKEEIHFGKGN